MRKPRKAGDFARAKLSYDQARATVEDIESDIRALSQDLQALGNPEESLKEALRGKEDFLIARGDDTAKTLLERLNTSLATLDREMSELKRCRETVLSLPSQS